MRWADFERADPGPLLTLLASESWRASQAVQLALTMLVQLCTIVVFVALLLLISWRLTLALVVGLAAVSWLVRRMAGGAKRTGRAAVDANARLGERMWEALAGMRTVRAFDAEDHERARFAAASGMVRRTFLRLDLLTGVAGPIAETLHVGLVLGIVVVALGDRGTLPALVAFAVLVYRLQPQLRTVETTRAALLGLLSAVRDVCAFIDVAGESAPVAAASPPALREAVVLEHVDFGYPGDARLVVQDVSFPIACGRVTAVVGASGAGKTLCTCCAATIPRPEDRGRWIALAALTGPRGAAASASVRTLPLQHHGRDNIAYGCAVPAMRRSGPPPAHARVRHRIARTATTRSSATAAYACRDSASTSRCAYLRCRPELLILDEATNALDGVSEHSVRRSSRRCAGAQW